MKAGLPRWIFWGLALFLGWQVLQQSTAILHHPYPLEYGEGVNLLWSQHAAEGQSLYPKISSNLLPQLHNPYPPLSPLLTAGFQRLGANAHPFYAGRLLSLFGLILASSAVFSLIHRRRNSSAGLIGVLFFLLSPMILRFGLMMRVDSLALGFSLQALNLLDLKKCKSAALLAALAICVKPSFFAAALTVAVITLQRRDLKEISRTALCGLAALLIILLWMILQPNSDWYLHLFTLQKLPPDFGSMFSWLARFVGTHAVWLTVAGFGYRKIEGPLKIYVVVALLPLLLTAWISGSQENYFMEIWAATCILSACIWPEIRDRNPRAAWLLALLQLGLFFPVAPAPVFTRTYGQEIPAGNSATVKPTDSDLEIGKLIQAELSAVPGPALSADLGYLIPAGHEPLYQPYQFEHLTAAGKWSADALHSAIRNAEFSVILLKGEAKDNSDPTFNPDTQQLIDQHYTLHRTLGPWYLYRPN